MKDGIIERYAGLVAKMPFLVIAIALLFTAIAFFGMQNVRMEGISYSSMLPDNIEEINAINFIRDEFGTTGDGISILLEMKPTMESPEYVHDIRRPDVLEYENIIKGKIEKIKGVSSVSSLASILKMQNGGRLPKTTGTIKRLMERELQINSTSLNVQQILADSSDGLAGLSKLASAQKNIMRGVSGGINGTSIALGQIQYALKQMREGMSATQDLSQLSQTIVLIGQIEALVSSSNATITEQATINGYLEGLKTGLNTMASQASESQAGISYLASSLQKMEISIKKMRGGLDSLSNASSLSSNMSDSLENGISRIGSGLFGVSNYMEFRDGKPKQAKAKSFNLANGYVSADYSNTLMKVYLDDISDKRKEEIIKELSDTLSETPKPAGISVGITGDSIVSDEMKNQVGPTMQATSMFSLLGILIIVFLLFLSIRHGLISLLAIVFGVIWVYGIMGILGFPINSMMSGSVSMIMGIGIDFGIQVVNRFRQEKKKMNIENALKVTLSNVLIPMSITTLAALIGFRAMSLGKITLLSDLGNMMSYGIFTSFIAAVTIIPAFLVINERIKKK